MARRKIWQLPTLRTEGDKNIHRAVTWLELFFDLFFVAVIASLSHELSGNITFLGFKNFVLTFVPVWWIWIGITFYLERFESEGIENRLFIFLLMLAVSGMAIYSHDVLGNNFRGYLLSYVVAKLIIIGLWARAGYYDKLFRPTAKRVVTGFSTSILIIIVAVILNNSFSLFLFAVALLIDLVTPLTTIKLQMMLPKFTKTKLLERFGLFTIIVLGEIVVGVIHGLRENHHFNSSLLFVGVMGIFTALGFWWIYFDFIARRPFHQNLLVMMVWIYAHMPLLIFFIMIGVGLDNLIAHLEVFKSDINTIYLCSVGLSLFLIGLLEFTLERAEDEPTHKYFSPVIKFITGILGIIIGLIAISPSVYITLVLGVVLILINIFYGVYAWFTQEVEDDKDEDEDQQVVLD